MPARIVVVGSANMDLVVRAPRIPSPGETVTGGSFLRADGGKGANQAVAAARLGAAVTFVARVGSDELGEAAIEGLRAEGIDVRHIGRDPAEPSGVALIVVDEAGENAIAVAPGANEALSVQNVEEARPAIESADVLLLQLETPLPAVKRAAELAAHAGAAVILNPAPARSLPDALLELVDVLTPNEGEAELLAEQATPSAAAAHLRQRGAARVVVTLGAAGALVCTGADPHIVPGFPVRAVDTTAAGDAFNGALAVALGSKIPLTEAVRFACGAGALAATAPGARPSLPSRARLDGFLRERTGSGA
jgi:ribokinase